MNKFFLEIITPEKTFYRGEVDSINIPALGGACTVMAGHQPMVFATEPGVIRITENGKTREAFMSEGFVEVRPDETIAFSEAVDALADMLFNRIEVHDEKRACYERMLKDGISKKKACQYLGVDIHEFDS